MGLNLLGRYQSTPDRISRASSEEPNQADSSFRVGIWLLLSKFLAVVPNIGTPLRLSMVMREISFIAMSVNSRDSTLGAIIDSPNSRTSPLLVFLNPRPCIATGRV